MSKNQVFEKIEMPKSVSDLVLEQLRKDILESRFELGEKLSEQRLAEMYGVTKAPIRACYIRLESEGLLEIKPRAGAYVFNPSDQQVTALCELRVALEVEAIALAMERNYEVLKSGLMRVQKGMLDCLGKAQLHRYQQLDAELHLVIIESADSAYLHETYCNKVDSRFAALRNRFSRDSCFEETSMNEHNALIDSILHRDLAKAQSLLRAHISPKPYYFTALNV